MAIKIQNIALSLALIFATNFLLSESTVTTTTKFDSYIGIAEKLTVPADRLRVYKAVWGEIQADGVKNLTQAKVFYDALQSGIKSTKPEEQEETAELSALVRDKLISGNAQLLAETLNNNKSQDVLQVTRYREQIYLNYDESLLNAIFEHAIDLAFAYHSAHELYNMLDAVDLTLNAIKPDVKYRVRVNWTLYMYWKFLARGEINDKYVYNAARAIHNLKRNTNYYKTLPMTTVRRIDKSFNTFTPSLRHLFNTTNVCLENSNFANYYLYFPVSVVGAASSIQAVLRNAFVEHSAWINSYADTTQSASADQFFLSYTQNYWLLYRRVSDLYMVVQRDTSQPANRYWTPSLNNEKIMFENYGYFMCATSDYNNSLQGFNVRAIKPKTLDDPMCQWRITNCAELK